MVKGDGRKSKSHFSDAVQNDVSFNKWTDNIHLPPPLLDPDTSTFPVNESSKSLVQSDTDFG